MAARGRGKSGPLSGLDALILCGGPGTRILPVLGDTPKVLAPIDGVPLLRRMLSALALQGLARAVLCLGHGSRAVIEYLALETIPGVFVVPSVEERPLGTAGALRLALGHSRGPTVLAQNGDTLVDLDWQAYVRFHRRRQAAITVATALVADRSRFGTVESDGMGRVERLVEKDPGGPGPGHVSAGVYLIERRVLEALPHGQVASLERDLLPGWVGRGLYSYTGVRGFVDIGTPEGYEAAGGRRASPP